MMSWNVSNRRSYEIKKIEEKSGIDELEKTKPNTNIPKKTASEPIDDDLNLTIHIFKKCKLRVYKPLLPLKFIFFFWHGGATFLGPFLILYMKQRGITLIELSTTITILPIVGILLTTLNGVLADKLGKLKPILLINILVEISCLGGVLLVPLLLSCHSVPVSLECHPHQLNRLMIQTTCDIVEDTIEVKSCSVQCPENVTEFCDKNHMICEILGDKEVVNNFSVSILDVEWTSMVTDGNRCSYNVSSMSYNNSTYSWCNVSHKIDCIVSCILQSDYMYATDNNRTLLVFAVLVLSVLVKAVSTSCCRLIDTISMSAVTKHKGDYGQNRLFACLGSIVLSPIAGLLVDLTSVSNSEKNYQSPLCFNMALMVVVLLAVLKLDVSEYQPGQKMAKKTGQLIRNPDIVAFALVVFVLGISFNFPENFLFWYLEEMKASSLLLGLIPAFESLYGLPFLATSGWWIKKMGHGNIFFAAFFAYTICFTSYSFLNDPWYALLLESTKAFTYHLLWVAVVVHGHSIAPDGLKATVVGTAGNIHFLIGQLASGAIGGVVMNNYGGHIAFRLLAVMCTCSAVIYAFFLYVRKVCFNVK